MSKSFPDALDNERTKYSLAVTAQFRKDYRLAKKRGLKMKALVKVVILLARGEALPEKNRDTACQETGWGIGNAMFDRIGC